MYIYNKTNYSGNNKKIIITCNIHGDFKQTPWVHMNGNGCNKCNYNKSKGIRDIEEILNINNIRYEEEYTFKDLRNKGLLRFDFAIFREGNLLFLIEYNGKQHYKLAGSFPITQEKFTYNEYNDKLKVKYCSDNNIPLLIIRFNQDHKEILNTYLSNNFFSLAQQCNEVQ